MGHYFTSRLRASHFISAADAMKAFLLFDKDDTGRLEFEEMQEAFNTMMAPAQVDISAFEGQQFTPKRFRDMAEQVNRKYPQYTVAANLMKYIREHWEVQEDDDQAISNAACTKLFKAFDPDGSGEMDYMELFKLFEFLRIPLRLLFQAGAAQDGKVTTDEFGPMLRTIDSEHPDLGVAEKINGFVAEISPDGPPDISGEPDPDPENDPAEVEQEEDAPPNKKALLVGINYVGSSCELGGCINDARNQLRVLTDQFGFSEDNILLLTEDQDDDSKLPKAETIRAGLDWLIDGAAEGDLLFFAYSGHGSQMPCRDGTEPDGKNEILCPLDLQEDWNANSIKDDYLFDVFYNRLPEGVRCICCYDCCHSGSMEDLQCTRDLQPPGEDVDVGDPADRFLTPPEDFQAEIDAAREAAIESGASKDLSNPADADKKLIWQISGCQDHQTSADATIAGQRQGAMTWALLASLEEGGLNGPWHFRYERLLTSMRQKLRQRRFTQIPAMATTEDALFERFYMANKP